MFFAAKIIPIYSYRTPAETFHAQKIDPQRSLRRPSDGSEGRRTDF